jgi:O-antigen/teichoic acid export membrane protein
MNRIFTKIPPGLQESLVLTLGNLISTAISAVSLIILARVLGPAKFGAFSVAFSITMLLAKFGDFGFNLSLQKALGNAKDNLIETQKLLRYSFKIKTIASGVLVLLSLPLSVGLSQLLFAGNHFFLVFLSVILTVVIIYFDYLNLAYISMGQSLTSAFMMIIQSLVKVAIVIAIFMTRQISEVAAYLAYGLSPLTGLVFGFKKLNLKPVAAAISPETKRSLWLLTRHTGMLTLAMAAADQIDVLLVQGLTDTYQTGLYSAASRIALLLSVVAYSVGSVLNARVARYQDKHNLRRYLGKAYLFSLISLLAAIVIVPLSTLMIRYTSGIEYIAADSTLKWLIVSGGLQVAAVTFTALFYSLNMPVYFTISGLLQVVILIFGNLILVPQMGIVGAGIVRTFMRLGVLMITVWMAHYALKRHHQLRFTDHLQSINHLTKSLWPH